MMTSKYQQKIAQLRTTSRSNEQIIARAINPRSGVAGKAPKFEAWFVDGDDARSVLLMEAFGKPNIRKAESIVDGRVYVISKYVIVSAGRSLTYLNNPVKMSFDTNTVIEEFRDADTIPDLFPRFQRSDVLGCCLCTTEDQQPLLLLVLLDFALDGFPHPRRLFGGSLGKQARLTGISLGI